MEKIFALVKIKSYSEFVLEKHVTIVFFFQGLEQTRAPFGAMTNTDTSDVPISDTDFFLVYRHRIGGSPVD